MTEKAIQTTWWNMPASEKKSKSNITLSEKVEFLKQASNAGGYLPANLVTAMLGVSRQYVQKLMDDGKLKTCVWYGMRFVEGNSLIEVLEERYNKKGGHPELASLRRLARKLKS